MSILRRAEPAHAAGRNGRPAGPLMTAALEYAGRGWRVFPCHSVTDGGGCSCGKPDCDGPGKHPRIGGWRKDATTDARQIRAWWGKWPGANIALALGPGMFALDTDVRDDKPGAESLAALIAQHGPLPDTLAARTGSGGTHYFFTAPDGIDIGNTAGHIAPGIDTRGQGGYVLLAPSRNDAGAYAWLNDSPIAPAPPWLLEALAPRSNCAPLPDDAGPILPREPARQPAAADRRTAAYLETVLAAEVENVRTATPGTRNASLNRAAFALGQRVAAGLDEGAIRAQLAAAAKAAGLGDSEIGPTLESGLKDGKASPKPIPDRPLRAAKHGPNGATKPAADHDPAEPDLGPLPGEAAPPSRPPPAAATGESDLPRIVINGRQMRDVTADALDALARANDPPALFVRGAQLAAIRLDENGEPLIADVDEHALRGRMARAADFGFTRPHQARTKKGEPPAPVRMEFEPTAPPLEIVRDTIALGAWPFPGLAGLVETPTMKTSGALIERPGYDRDTGLFYHPAPGLRMAPIPAKPTRADVETALATLREPLRDFPFADDASRTNALALVLTPIVRPAIAGCVPLALIDAPQAGTGKSLLARLVGIVATGHDPRLINAPRDDDEWRKRITTLVLGGAQVVSIDNLSGTLYSGALSAAVTATTWADRILGQSKDVSLPQRAVFVATGNNIRLGGDIPRRCYWIRLDAQMSRPYQRTEFAHADIAAWTLANRGAIVAAALTLARAWVQAGRPDGKAPRMGSFESWAGIVGGILAHAGAPAFLGNLEELLESADEDGPAWEAFLIALGDALGGQAATINQICARLEADPALADLIPPQFDAALKADRDGRATTTAAFKRALGYQFRARKMTRYGDSQVRIERVTKEGGHEKTAVWRIAARQWTTKAPNSPKNAGDAGDAGDVSYPSRCEGQIPIDINIDARIENTRAHGERPEVSPASPASPANSAADELRALVLASLENGPLGMATLARIVQVEVETDEAAALAAIKAAAAAGLIVFDRGQYWLAGEVSQ